MSEKEVQDFIDNRSSDKLLKENFASIPIIKHQVKISSFWFSLLGYHL